MLAEVKKMVEHIMRKSWLVSGITALCIFSTVFPTAGLMHMNNKTNATFHEHSVFFDGYLNNIIMPSGSGIDLIAYDIWISDQFHDFDKQHTVAHPVEGQKLYYHMLEKIDPPQIVPRHRVEARLDGAIRSSWYVEYNSSTPGIIFCSNESNPIIAQAGTHTLRFNVDVNNNVTETNESNNIKTFTFIVAQNHPPNTPDTPSGPSNGYTDISYAYSTKATDSDGNKIQYRFDWGDGTPYSNWTGLVNSGDSVNVSHIWSSEGTYNVKAQARDEHGAESGWSNQLTVTIVDEQNQPPEGIVIYGANIVIVDTLVIYRVSVTDEEGDTIKCLFDWGDGTQNWTTYFASGDYSSLSHTWLDKGNYVLRVKAQDEHGAESDWVTKGIIVPKSYENPYQHFVENLLKWFFSLPIFKITT